MGFLEDFKAALAAPITPEQAARKVAREEFWVPAARMRARVRNGRVVVSASGGWAENENPWERRQSLLAYSEDEPRDEHGRWTGEGGEAAAPAGGVFGPHEPRRETPELIGTSGFIYMSDNPGTQLVNGREQAFWKMTYWPDQQEQASWIPDASGFPHHDDIRAELYPYEQRGQGLNFAGYGPAWTADEEQKVWIEDNAQNQAAFRTQEELG